MPPRSRSAARPPSVRAKNVREAVAAARSGPERRRRSPCRRDQSEVVRGATALTAALALILAALPRPAAAVPPPRRRPDGRRGGEAPRRRDDRQPDGPWQPSLLPPRPALRGAPPRADGLFLHAAGDRPRRAEADQRRPRTPGRRHVHPAGQRMPAAGDRRRRDHLPDRRRRVHGAAARPPELARVRNRAESRRADTRRARPPRSEHRRDGVDGDRDAADADPPGRHSLSTRPSARS